MSIDSRAMLTSDLGCQATVTILMRKAGWRSVGTLREASTLARGHPALVEDRDQ